MNRGRCAEGRARQTAEAGDKIPKHRSEAGQDRSPSRSAPGPVADATAVIPVIRASDATQIRVYRAVPVEWNWRVVVACAFFCFVSFCVAGIIGIFGERDGLYLAAFGLGGLLTPLTFITIDWHVQKGRERK